MARILRLRQILKGTWLLVQRIRVTLELGSDFDFLVARKYLFSSLEIRIDVHQEPAIYDKGPGAPDQGRPHLPSLSVIPNARAPRMFISPSLSRQQFHPARAQAAQVLL